MLEELLRQWERASVVQIATGVPRQESFASLAGGSTFAYAYAYAVAFAIA